MKISITISTVFFFAFFLISYCSIGQYDHVWVFGNKAGMDFSKGGDPVPITTNINGWGEACASVCNEQGELQFYTEGNVVWDSNHNIMPNGTSLVPFPPCMSSSFNATTSSAAQGTLIVPYPGNPSKYYIFSLTAYECEDKMGMLYYSIVDMNLNNGLGDVSASSKGILIDTGFSEKITSVPGNSCNVWVIVQKKDGSIYAYEIKSTGVISDPVISHLYDEYFYFRTIIGIMTPSLEGSKIAITGLNAGSSSAAGIWLIDFNIYSGEAKLNLTLSQESAYGICFSPDDSKLYVNFGENSGSASIFQYNLNNINNEDIIASATKIGDLTRLAQLKTAPDGKIYFSGTTFFTSDIGSIPNPNLAGLACQFIPVAVTLNQGTAGMLGMPNTISIIKGSDDTLYTNIYDTNHCFKNTFSMLIDSNAYQIQWDNGSIDLQREVNQPGTYWVKYKLPGELCLHRLDSFHVFFKGTLPIVFSSSSCKKDNNGSAWYVHTYSNWDTLSNYKYVWGRMYEDKIISVSDTLKDVPPGIYTLNISNQFGCDTTLQVFINQENDSLAFNVDSIICEGSEVNFENNSSYHYTIFDWDFGNGNYSVQKNPSNQYNNSGKYEITMVGRGEKCKDTISAFIEVDAPIEVNFDFKNKEVCVGEKIIVFPSPYNDSTLIAFEWNVGQSQYIDQEIDSSYTFSFDFSGAIPIVLLAHYRACPNSTVTDTFFVHDLPKVDLGADTSICLDDIPIILKNKHKSHLEEYYNLWSTGDTTSTLKVTHHGTYSLTVTSDPLGCSSTETIVIEKDCYIDIPNAFTPNGDGGNDFFFPRQLLSKNITKFHMQIFNRWGQLMYETRNTDGRGWDGQFNGVNQPQGVYLYHIQLEIDGRSNEQYQGNVTLIR